MKSDQADLTVMENTSSVAPPWSKICATTWWKADKCLLRNFNAMARVTTVPKSDPLTTCCKIPWRSGALFWISTFKVLAENVAVVSWQGQVHTLFVSFVIYTFIHWIFQWRFVDKSAYSVFWWMLWHTFYYSLKISLWNTSAFDFIGRHVHHL